MRIAKCTSALAAAFYYHQGLGFELLAQYDNALVSFNKALLLKPDCTGLFVHRSSVLYELMRYDESLASCDKAIDLKSDYGEAYYRRGTILMRKGDLKEAEAMFTKALALNPHYLTSLVDLSALRKYQNINHPDVKYIQSLLSNPTASLSGIEYLYFVLGKIHDDCGLYEEAFAYYQKANQLCSKQVSYIPKVAAKNTDRIIDAFNIDFLTRSWNPDNQLSPLFIVGMPRSGTTLMAQILSNHPTIVSAGELTTIPELAVSLRRSIKKRLSYPEVVKYITPDLAFHIASAYEKRLRRDAGPNVSFVIDKNPLNFKNLGFISLLFPKARIIHCMRHPLDTGLSNYFQRFRWVMNYAFDLRNIGHFYAEYSRLMVHWRNALPIPILEVQYEDMVTDAEPTIRRMLSFLGLDWNERCLSPHTNPGAVETVSSWQVRQPIYQHSIGRWRHYEKHLGPLKDMLGELCDSYPAQPKDQAVASKPF